jgi:hypothetical protein
MVDYSRWDNVGDSSDEEPEAPASPLPMAPRSLSPRSPPQPPSDVLDDLEDYFVRLDTRRAEQQADAEAVSVARFTEDEIARLPQASGSARYSECAICMEDFGAAEAVVVLPCAAGHCFHPGCARSCLTRSTQCPLCRVDLRPIMGPPPSRDGDGVDEEGVRAPPSPRELGFTRDGGTILRFEPHPAPEIPRPSYIPSDLHQSASLVEIEYPEQGVARVWRVPRDASE